MQSLGAEQGTRSESETLDQLSSEDLCRWCVHSMRLDLIGLPTYNSLEISLQRVLAPGVKAIVFLDLDETLTATNFTPEEFFDELLEQGEAITDAHVDAYMLDRVPRELRSRVHRFLLKLDALPGVEWFILTNNIFAMARCTLKLAFHLDVKPGTIIDRNMRSNVINGREVFLDKRQLIEAFVLSRADDGLPPAKIVFVDNLAEHRAAVAATLEPSLQEVRSQINDRELEKSQYLYDTPSLICCDDLHAGMTDEHIEQVLNFVTIVGK